MYKEGFRRALRSFYILVRPSGLSISGKVTLLAVSGVALLLLVVGFAVFNTQVPTVSADALQTSVNVLNTPPQWTVIAQEYGGSSTSTPTNAGSVLQWIATATDSGNDNYWLIICSASSTPTANTSAAPTCSSGFQWAVSAQTTSGSTTIAATTTLTTAGSLFDNESNPWYAYVCDGNPSLPRCNSIVEQGSGTTSSPFVINHPPKFTSLSNNGPIIPGGTVTWSAVATDTDVIRGGDLVELYICKAADFTGSACGAGGTWATSTQVTHNPTASYTAPVPTQDKTYSAFAYVADQLFEDATSTLEGSSTPYAVSNVAPSVSASSITLLSISTTSPTLILTTPQATSGPYEVTFQVTDNNSCLNASSGNEISSVAPNVYLSSIGSTTCSNGSPGNYNPNNCYPSSSTQTDFSCTQDAGSCTGASDSTATFTCKFSFWYNADPTDGGSPFNGQTWNASVIATDDQGATSSLAESTTGSKSLTSFLAFAVTQTAIAYGGLQPGQQSPDPLATTTTLKELGNVGIDENLYGDTMCTTWSAPDSCDNGGFDATKDIPIANQKAATSSISTYAAAFALTGSTSPIYLGVHVPKTTATSSPQNKNTYWGIAIPGGLTISGTYSGQNTITALTSSSTNW